MKRAKVAADFRQLRSSLTLGSAAQSVGKVGLSYASRLGGATLTQAKKNPLPMATIAAGVVWLFVANSRAQTGEPEKGAPQAARDVAQTPPPEDVMVAEDNNTSEEKKNDTVGAFVADHPFVLGALALAAGAALGQILPRTKAEDDLVASTQDLLHAEKQRFSRVAQTLRQEAEGILSETKADLDRGAPEDQTAADAIDDLAKSVADRMTSAAVKVAKDGTNGKA